MNCTNFRIAYQMIYVASMIAVLAIILWTLLIKVPSSLRILTEMQESATMARRFPFTSFDNPAQINLPLEWQEADGIYMIITDEDLFLSRKVDEHWICVDVNRMARDGT